MSKALNRGTIIGVWFAVLAVVAGADAVGGVSITMGTRTLLSVACLVPSTGTSDPADRHDT